MGDCGAIPPRRPRALPPWSLGHSHHSSGARLVAAASSETPGAHVLHLAAQLMLVGSSLSHGDCGAELRGNCQCSALRAIGTITRSCRIFLTQAVAATLVGLQIYRQCDLTIL